MELYDLFIKNLHVSIPKDNIDPLLEKVFSKINAGFFNNQIETPNLVWGTHSTRKLGSYDFQTDTISISKIFQNIDRELLEYVMYHEVLHKHFKFKSNISRNHYHSKEFREAEKAFPNVKEIERRLKYLPNKPKKPSFFSNLTKSLPFRY